MSDNFVPQEGTSGAVLLVAASLLFSHSTLSLQSLWKFFCLRRKNASHLISLDVPLQPFTKFSLGLDIFGKVL